MSRQIILAAGGTGGHMFPAEALAAELVERGRSLALMTDRRGAGFGDNLPAVEVHQLRAGHVAGRGLIGRVMGLADIAIGVLQARRLLARLKPVGVVGFGGYASVPAVLAATQLGLPTIIHEQNAVLGRANRLLAPRVRAIATSFTETSGIDVADAIKTEHIGNPVRAAVVALRDRPYPATVPGGPLSLLVTGGSQGATVMSEVVPPALAALPAADRSRLHVVQQCRIEDIERVRETYRLAGIDAELEAFYDDLPARLGAAQLVIARAGASTIAELTTAGRPAILVPYPSAADDHQSANAAALVRAGGGWAVDQPSFTPISLAARIAELLDQPIRLAEAAARSRRAGIPDAALRLTGLVERRMPADGCGANGARYRNGPGEIAA